MLEEAGLTITCLPADIDESAIKNRYTTLPKSQLAEKLAQAKALHIASTAPKDAIVIGADQICECAGKVLSKPDTTERAIQQLSEMNGKTHYQHSGVSIYQGDRCLWTHTETASLTLRQLSTEEITRYVQLDQPLSSCGSYKLESYGKHLFKNISGSDSTIQGLPLIPLLAFLHQKGYLSIFTE